MSNSIVANADYGITLTNAQYSSPVTITGTVAAATGDGVFAGTVWSIDNFGIISASSGEGIALKAGGLVINSGTVHSGASYGLSSTNGPMDVVNSGSIYGGTAGILMTQSSLTLDNQSTGVITGGTGSSEAVDFSGVGPATSTLTNQGTIIDLRAGSNGGVGLILNQAAATNTSAGEIIGGKTGVLVETYADFTNAGTIVGQTGIVVAANPVRVTIVDSGTISGLGSDAISFTPGQNAAHPSLLELLPGAVLEGIANGGAVANLEFGGSLLGIMSSVGSEITAFSTISLTSGANWEFGGLSSLVGQNLLVNDGTIDEMAGDSLSVGSTVSGTGTIVLAGGDLAFSNVVDQGITVNFAAPGSSMAFNQGHSFAGTISGFAQGDTIDITGFGSGQLIAGHLSGNDFTVTGGASNLVIDFAAAPGTLAIEPDGEVGGFKTYEVIMACFAAGTAILTPHGPRSVETLRKGDLVVTHHGETRPIVWCGHRRIDCDRHPKPELILPVMITAGAFAPGIPSRDLYLSPDHAIYCDNVLIPAKFLINGVTIRQIDVPEVIYYHIELAQHGVVWAETLPAETYLDCGNRHHFHRRKGAVSLHPDFQAPVWDAQRAFAPLVIDGPCLTAVRQRLLERVVERGWRRVGGSYSVYADGRVLESIDADNGQTLFRLPFGATWLTIESSSTSPGDLDPASADRRKLGIAIADVTFDGTMVEPTDTRFRSGFYEAEQRGRRWFRWTNGSAVVCVARCREIAFTIQAVSQIWQVAPGAAPAAMPQRRVLELR